jgi:hypothetical protein
MSTELIPDVLAQMQEAADRVATGTRDHEAALRACESMDRTSEAIRRRQGILDFGVRAIREHRDS